MDIQTVKAAALDIRKYTVHTIGTLGVGHIGGCLSIADALAVLYYDKLNIDPKNPQMKGRDRLVMSKGHAGPALYATLALKGFFPMSWLDTLNQPETRLPSHCDMNKTPGIDMTAGSLGQGISAAVGIAKAAKNAGGTETVYAIIGDGESQEGLVWEAIMSAAHFKLDNFIVLLDNNKMQIDGIADDVMKSFDFAKKFEAFGLFAQNVDGHDLEAISNAIDTAKKSTLPSAIVLDTVKGKGVSFIEEAGFSNHSMPISKEQMSDALKELGGQK